MTCLKIRYREGDKDITKITKNIYSVNKFWDFCILWLQIFPSNCVFKNWKKDGTLFKENFENPKIEPTYIYIWEVFMHLAIVLCGRFSIQRGYICSMSVSSSTQFPSSHYISPNFSSVIFQSIDRIAPKFMYQLFMSLNSDFSWIHNFSKILCKTPKILRKTAEI